MRWIERRFDCWGKKKPPPRSPERQGDMLRRWRCWVNHPARGEGSVGASLNGPSNSARRCEARPLMLSKDPRPASTQVGRAYRPTRAG